MKILTIDQAKDLLLEEYPKLNKDGLEIIKQYSSTDGRTFNTFLVSDRNKGIFIAKGAVYADHGLEGEWCVLKIMQASGLGAPTFLYPDHKPHNFLLLSYIAGVNASEQVTDTGQAESIFFEVGKTTGRLHSIPVKEFGDLQSPEKISWREYLDQKIIGRLDGSREIITSELFMKSQEYLLKMKPILEKEDSTEPRLIHRDIYLDNFIISEKTNEAVLIDYAMAIGGRPFYDLAKFYILELYKRPEFKNSFLSGYSQSISLPDDFNSRMRLYILKESLGMICYFNKIGEIQALNHAIRVLEELVNEKGIIAELLN